MSNFLFVLFETAKIFYGFLGTRKALLFFGLIRQKTIVFCIFLCLFKSCLFLNLQLFKTEMS
ncbi:hypothetical protein A3K73_05615 [Candidatus Pacearchaeota archaeon RBG_13_36_9]|nr:MAG: hypothetical protein A3K73_05615 [Candidatus Pacearchaeota archaeon RBG_13_36_9]